MTEQQGFVLWMTGLSGAGKTTIALEMLDQLAERDLRLERLDGDVVRESLTRDLGFSKEDREKNIERVTFVAKLLSRNGVGCICSFISPYQSIRDDVRAQTTNFLEVFVDAPLDVVIDRDVKGMYKKALAIDARALTYYEEITLLLNKFNGHFIFFGFYHHGIDSHG